MIVRVACLVFCLGLNNVVAESPISVHEVSLQGSTRATRYLNANKIVTLTGKTHVAWLDSVSKAMVASYDHNTRQWSPAVLVGEGVDNHGGPALTCDSLGFLHLLFGPHAREPFQHCRSVRPNDSSEWVQLPTFGTNATYPSVVCDAADTLHVVYRGGVRPNHPFQLLYQRLPKGGLWSKPIVLAKCPDSWEDYTAYHASLAIDSQDNLHLAFNYFFDRRSQKASYLQSKDGGNTWLLAEGEDASLPVTVKSPATFLDTDDISQVIDCVTDSRNHPWVAVQRRSKLTIHHHDGSAWRAMEVQVENSTEQVRCSLWGTLSIGADDRLFVPAIASRGVAGTRQGNVLLFWSANSGQSFRQLRLHDADDRQPHGGLSLERATGNHRVSVPKLLFSTGPKGNDVYGKGLSHVVRVVDFSTGVATSGSQTKQ